MKRWLRPTPKLHVRFSRMQLSRRLSDAKMREKELNRSAEQARTHRRAESLAATSSPHFASAGTNATRFVAGPSRCRGTAPGPTAEKPSVSGDFSQT